MVIYLVFKNGECVYVGQTCQSLDARKAKHLSEARNNRGNILGAAIRKHGEECFYFLEYIKCSSQEELDLTEKELVQKIKPRYNIQSGGKSNFKPWNKGKKENRDFVLNNISKAAKTRKRTKRGAYSLEHKKKISRSRLEQLQKPFICHQNNKVYYNKKECALELGLNASSLSVLLTKKTRLKSLKGFTFSYLSAE